MAARSLSLWLLWLVFAALVAALLWTVLGACALGLPGGARWIGHCPIAIEPLAANPELDQERERADALWSAVRELELAVLERPYCPAPEPPRALVQPPAAPEPAPRVEPDPPVAQVEPDPAPELPPCPPERRRATEVVLLLDLSGSMIYDFELEPAIEQRINAIWQEQQQLQRQIQELQATGNVIAALTRVPQLVQRMQQLEQELGRLEQQGQHPDRVNRIDVAKRALSDLVDNADDDVDFSFVTFSQCGNPNLVGHYEPPNRGRLKAAINGARTFGPTALADGINALPQVMRGGDAEDRPVNVVLVSDGSDSCNGDPCAAARQLKQSRPFAFVNAIAIGRMAEQVQCVPAATGGVFVGADDAEELAAALVSAAGQDLPEHCQ